MGQLERALVLDIGNTRIKYGGFELGELTINATLEQKNVDALLDITRAFQPSHILVSGSGKIPTVLNSLKDHGEVFFADADIQLPIGSSYDKQSKPGIDRIANACALNKMFSGQNALAIDMGTCVTYDLLRDGVFKGGIIAPGLQMRARAMHEFTAALPLVEIPQKAIFSGNSTLGCLQSGVLNGWTKEIEGCIETFKNNFSDLQIVLTGGDTIYFAPPLKSYIFADPFLTLRGLYQILLFNAR
ncbi:MAG: type III pantothenate kinase [Cryomorphaceae bacterium]|nr:type III pantothenate kinase [Cryomorphaceae bacterium]